MVPGVATDAAPSWTAHAGESVWLAWRGTGSNTSVFVAGTSTFQPAQGSGLYSFGPQHKVDGASATGSPAIASLEGTLYLFWTNAADGQIWWANSSDGETWAGVQALVLGGNEIPASSLSPAVVSGNGSLYLAWKGANTDTRIWFATFTGKTWSDQESISPASGGTPAAGSAVGIALQGSTVHVAWAGAERSSLWWSARSNGAWAPQKEIFAGPAAGAALVVDGNGVLWMAWSVPTPGVPFSGALCFASLGADGTWSRQTSRWGIASALSPSLVSTGDDPTGIMMAWKGNESDTGIYYGPLRLPAITYDFGFAEINIRNMRTGHAGFKDGTDTDFASFGVQLAGQPPTILTASLGNQTGGVVPVKLNVPRVVVQDTDSVFMTYFVTNSSQPGAADFVANVASNVLTAVEKADEAAIKAFFGVDLSWLTPAEAGALLGAQLGNTILPGLGVVIGAVAGYLASDVFGFFQPDCDGPVAVGVHVFTYAELRNMVNTPAPYVAAEDNPGITSASGCGSNSDYVVVWQVAAAS